MSYQSPDTKNYTLGKGRLYFNRKYTDSTPDTGFRDLGNCSALSYSAAIDKIEHYSSRGGISVKDAEVISQITPSTSFTLDEITADNLALLSLATQEAVTQASAIGETTSTVARTKAWVFLGGRNVSNVVVKDESDTTTYVEGTDYRMRTTDRDFELGRMYIIEGGGITDGDTVNVTFDVAETETIEVRAFNESEVLGELFFMSDNPKGGQRELYMWNVSITPSGDTALIGEDWMTLEFSGELTSDEVNHPESPYMTIVETV